MILFNVKHYKNTQLSNNLTNNPQKHFQQNNKTLFIKKPIHFQCQKPAFYPNPIPNQPQQTKNPINFKVNLIYLSKNKKVSTIQEILWDDFNQNLKIQENIEWKDKKILPANCGSTVRKSRFACY